MKAVFLCSLCFVLDFTTARSSGFHSMTLHIYFCALIWWVSLCVEIYRTDAGFSLDLYVDIDIDNPPPPPPLVLDKEDLTVYFFPEKVSWFPTTRCAGLHSEQQDVWDSEKQADSRRGYSICKRGRDARHIHEGQRRGRWLDPAGDN